VQALTLITIDIAVPNVEVVEVDNDLGVEHVIQNPWTCSP
jgi:hypothetical protein